MITGFINSCLLVLVAIFYGVLFIVIGLSILAKRAANEHPELKEKVKKVASQHGAQIGLKLLEWMLKR